MAHQTGDASPADHLAFSTKRGLHPRRAITATMLGLETPDIAEQMTVGDEPSAVGAILPCIVAAGRDLQHAAHEPDRPRADVIADEREPHLGTSAKMPMAFLGRRAPYACDRDLASAAKSRQPGRLGTAGAALRPRPLAERAAPVWMATRQFRGIDGEMPTSVATCINGRPLLSSSATASRLNSGANSRLVLDIQTPSRPSERINGVHQCEGPSEYPNHVWSYDFVEDRTHGPQQAGHPSAKRPRSADLGGMAGSSECRMSSTSCPTSSSCAVCLGMFGRTMARSLSQKRWGNGSHADHHRGLASARQHPAPALLARLPPARTQRRAVAGRPNQTCFAGHLKRGRKANNVLDLKRAT